MTKTESLVRFVEGRTEHRPERITLQVLQSVNQFFKGYSDITDVAEFKPQHVEEWLLHLKQKGNTSSCIRQKLVSLNNFFRWLVKVGFLFNNPCEGIVYPLKFPTVDIIDSDTLAKLCAIAQNQSRDLLIILLAMSGLRLKEIVNLKYSDIDFANQTLYIHSKIRPKGIHMSELSFKLLNLYLSTNHVGDSELIFGHYTRTELYIRKMLNRYAKLLGLESLSIRIIRMSCIKISDMPLM